MSKGTIQEDRIIGTIRPLVTAAQLAAAQTALATKLDDAMGAAIYTLERSVPIEAAVTALECWKRDVSLIVDGDELLYEQAKVDDELRQRIERNAPALIRIVNCWIEERKAQK